jgi:glycosyltransferase involved in cell wall biosynthesis
MNVQSVIILTDGMTAGGTERQIVELLKGLKKERYIRSIIGILMNGGELEREAYKHADKIMPISQHSRFDFTLAISLLRFIKNHHVDIIHTFGVVSDLSGVIAGKILNKPNICGSIRSARPKLNIYDRFSKLCMAFSTSVVANSHAGLKAFGIENNEKASVIYNGIDLSRFKKVEPISFGKPTLCMVGNFTKKKDQASIIRALPLVKKEFSGVKLILIGRGKLLYKCRQLSELLELNENVKFITDTNNPEPFITGSQICILISPGGEGISNAILEYMALGKPVIASDIGGNRELIENYKTGILIKDHSKLTISESILHLLKNPDISMELGMSAKKYVEDKFNAQRMVDDYIELYLKLSSLR